MPDDYNMQTQPDESPAAALWHYNATLLTLAIGMIKRLQAEALPDFVYARAVGPHVRHIIEHYQILLAALVPPTKCVDYDVRTRDLGVQSDPTLTLEALESLVADMHGRANDQHSLLAPLTTRLQAGLRGELELTVPTTLGRELLFVASHTVHHYALLAHHCRAAGVELGHDFGVAPATVAFQQKQAVVSTPACA